MIENPGLEESVVWDCTLPWHPLKTEVFASSTSFPALLVECWPSTSSPTYMSITTFLFHRWLDYLLVPPTIKSKWLRQPLQAQCLIVTTFGFLIVKAANCYARASSIEMLWFGCPAHAYFAGYANLLPKKKWAYPAICVKGRLRAPRFFCPQICRVWRQGGREVRVRSSSLIYKATSVWIIVNPYQVSVFNSCGAKLDDTTFQTLPNCTAWDQGNSHLFTLKEFDHTAYNWLGVPMLFVGQSSLFAKAVCSKWCCLRFLSLDRVSLHLENRKLTTSPGPPKIWENV